MLAVSGDRSSQAGWVTIIRPGRANQAVGAARGKVTVTHGADSSLLGYGDHEEFLTGNFPLRKYSHYNC